MTPFARAACTRLSVSAHAIVKRLVLGIFVAIPLRDILSLTELRTEPHRLRKLEDRIRIEDIGMFDPIGDRPRLVLPERSVDRYRDRR